MSRRAGRMWQAHLWLGSCAWPTTGGLESGWSPGRAAGEVPVCCTCLVNSHGFALVLPHAWLGSGAEKHIVREASLALPPAASRPPAGAPLCCPARALPAGRPGARSKVTLLRELDDKTLYLLASKMTPFRYSPACPSRNPAFVLGGLFPCSLLANAWAKSKGA